MGQVLPFPGQKGGGDPAAAKALALGFRPPPDLQRFDERTAVDLMRLCRSVMDGEARLVEFVDSDRDLASAAGVETIAIELSAMLEAGAMDRVLDALEHAAAKGRPVDLTLQGLGKLRRAEGLLSEAASRIRKHTGCAPDLGASGTIVGSRMGVSRPTDAPDLILLIPLIGLGAIAVLLILFGGDRNASSR
jgi:hypothetical protein